MGETPGAILVSVGRQAVESVASITRQLGDSASVEAGYDRLSSHVAPLGLVFSQACSLPDSYRDGVFVGEHGSWDRNPISGYKVVYIPFKDGRPAGNPVDVVTGFLSPQERTRGRPVGLALDKSGALLIADDVGNTVWRVSALAK